MKTSRILLNVLVLAALTSAGIASANETSKEGYLTDARGTVARNNYGDCWKTSYWTPAMAIQECDPSPARKEQPKVAEARTRAAPVEAPAPAPVAGPDKPAFFPINLQANTLFDFNKSDIHAEGKKTLDNEIVAKMKENPQVEVVLVTGYTDRIGSDAYNQKLSERRANAVKAYLVSQGIEDKRIETAAKGEANPIAACDDVKGRANGKNHKLVACLQPNRRVMVEVSVQQPAQK